MRKISLAELLVRNEPVKTKKFIAYYGMKPCQRSEGAVIQIDKIIARHKEEALKLIAQIHPHRDLFDNGFSNVVGNLPENGQENETVNQTEKVNQEKPERSTEQTLALISFGILSVLVLGIAMKR